MEPGNITPRQRELLKDLAANKENFLYEWDEVRGVLSFVRADNLQSGQNGAINPESNKKIFTEFLKGYALLFGPEDLVKGLETINDKRDNIGWHHYQYQFYLTDSEGDNKRRVEFYSSKVIAHFNANGMLVEIQSSCYRDIAISNIVKIKVQELQQLVLAEIKGMKGFQDLEKLMKRRKEKLFPIMQNPRHVIYPWKGKMLHTWATYGYSPYIFEEGNNEKEKEKKPTIAFGQMFFNAETGELFLFSPTRKSAETSTTGSGLGCTPLGGPYINRSLEIVRVDSTSTYLLKNKTKARDIITYDANADSSIVYPNIPQKISDGDVDVSTDNDGDKNWNRVAANTTDTERTSSQQPEVDEHYIVAELYDWYNAVGGRVGWDDNDFSAPLVPNQSLNVVAHTYDDDAGTSRSVNAFFDSALVNGSWVSHLAFFDGDPTGATNSNIVDDYLAGSNAIVGHEYQHAVTDFSFKDGMGNPGLTYSGWFAAIHEGTSDVFGGLFSADWWMGQAISPTGQIFRNLAFPRDPTTLVNTALSNHSKDHFDDRNLDGGFRYDRGTILAHCAYLMAQGGVHQRSSRNPVLIPVKGLGRETVGGKDVYKAARIWYRGLSQYLSNIGAMTGIPTNDENIFRSFRNATISAAIDLYGINSIEHKTTILAWYAVGLHPVGENYGPDITFLTWGADWWMSRPYIGISSPDWSSVDLFINNGGSSEWNAKVNVLDMGTPTQFENKVYCRVRNVGTQISNNVQVQFEYAKITTSGVTWLPMTDKDGNIQVLNVGNLAAGASNFPDSEQNTPPGTAMIKWWIPPIESGETVNHYCIKATTFSISDGNLSNNSVQSNVAYAPYVPGSGFRMGFFAGNPYREVLPLDIRLQHSLPKGWNVHILEQINGLILKPGESKRAHVVIDIPNETDHYLVAPFDGRIKGQLADSGLTYTYTGVLFNGKLNNTGFSAQLSLNTSNGTLLTGSFDGSLNITTAKFKGELKSLDKEKRQKIFRIEGCLRPNRIVNIGQYLKGEPFSGFSIQVQVPLPEGSCFEELPPTHVFVEPVIPHDGEKDDKKCIEGAQEIIKCLNIQKQDICSIKLKSILVEIKYKDRDC